MEPKTGPDGASLNAVYINKAGIHKLIMKSRMPNAVDVAKEFNIMVEKKYVRKEIEIVAFVQTFLTGLSIPLEPPPPKKKGRVIIELTCVYQTRNWP